MTNNGASHILALPRPVHPIESDLLPIGSDMQWFVALLERLPRGTNLLMGGDPGVGKSTLAQQLAISAALAGERVLIIATEQSRGALVSRMHALAGPIGCCSLDELPIEIIDDIGDLALLPQLLARQVFARNGRLAGTGLIIIDSLHGLGNGPADKRFYSSLYEYLRTASAAGVTTLALAHMTKAREVSGPRALEHMIDASLIMRHGVSCRALYVPKNRGGASRMEPFSVVIDEVTTRLVPSPLAASSSARVRTISCDGPTTIEVALALPKHERGFVKAPGLSPQEAAIIVDLMARIHSPGRSIGSLGVTVRAPGGVRYIREHSLPIAVAIAAALARAEVDERLVIVGDIDLRGGVAPLGGNAMRLIDDASKAGLLRPHDTIIGARPAEGGDLEPPAWHWREVRSITETLAAIGVGVSRPAEEGGTDGR